MEGKTMSTLGNFKYVNAIIYAELADIVFGGALGEGVEGLQLIAHWVNLVVDKKDPQCLFCETSWGTTKLLPPAAFIVVKPLQTPDTNHQWIIAAVCEHCNRRPISKEVLL